MEGDLQRRLGRNLRQWREARGLSQEGFADLLGYHRTYVGGVERGERNLTLRSVERIANTLQVDAFTLLEPRQRPDEIRAAEQRAGYRRDRPTGSGE